MLDAFASAGPAPASSVRVMAAGGYDEVIGRYLPRDGGSEVPAAFAAVCAQNGWDVQATWAKLNGGAGGIWFAHEDSANESYINFNGGDKMWWIDGPDGLGAFKAPGPSWAPPCSETAWLLLREGIAAGPTLLVHRG